jgi:hypothetical protein
MITCGKDGRSANPKKSSSHVIQQIRSQEDHRRDGTINFKFNQNLAIILYNNISLSKYSTFEAGTGNKTT